MSRQADQIRKAINKKQKKVKANIVFPTGSDLLDIVVSGGQGEGYPGGRIINIVGDKSSGKTFLACEIIAASRYKYKNRLEWDYDDCESGFTFDTRHIYGFEIMPSDVSKRRRSQTVEEAYCNIRDFFERLKAGQLGIYVLDSLDGLTSDESNGLAEERFKSFKTNKKFDKGSYKMGKAKYLSQEFFPQLADLLEKKNGLLIIISQVRDNVDPMSFERYSRTGGKAMDFYCHTVLWLAQVHKIKKRERAIGVTVKAKTTKSKTPRPYRELFFNLLFDYGIDNIGTNIDFLYDLLTNTGLLVKNASVRWGDKEGTLAELRQFLQAQNIERLYRKKVSPKLKRNEVAEWLENNENKAIVKAYHNEFGSVMNRDDMIAYIEKNSLQSELKRKVVEKWESIEESIRVKRAPKYGSVS
jgi:recombination protein RecA